MKQSVKRGMPYRSRGILQETVSTSCPDVLPEAADSGAAAAAVVL